MHKINFDFSDLLRMDMTLNIRMQNANCSLNYSIRRMCQPEVFSCVRWCSGAAVKWPFLSFHSISRQHIHPTLRSLRCSLWKSFSVFVFSSFYYFFIFFYYLLILGTESDTRQTIQGDMKDERRCDVAIHKMHHTQITIENVLTSKICSANRCHVAVVVVAVVVVVVQQVQNISRFSDRTLARTMMMHDCTMKMKRTTQRWTNNKENALTRFCSLLLHILINFNQI